MRRISRIIQSETSGDPEKFSNTRGMLNLSECEQIFFNEPLIILEDPKHSLSEKRWAAFGKTEADRLLTIIYSLN